MPNLDGLLSFPTPQAGPSSPLERTAIPPRSSHIVVTDTIDSPASFVLVHFVRAAHAASKISRTADHKGKARDHDIKVIWVQCNADGTGHLKNVLRKSGVQLDVEAQKGCFAFIDANEIALSHSEQDDKIDLAALRLNEDGRKPQRALADIYHAVRTELARGSRSAPEAEEEDSWTSDSIVIVDDLSSLSWCLDNSDAFGNPVDVAHQVKTWVQALTDLATNSRACVVTLSHVDAASLGKDPASDSVDDAVLRGMLQTADVWIEVKELTSGRARDCDGEITVHPLLRPSLAQSLPSSTSEPNFAQDRVPPLQAFKIETPCPNRSKAVLYRIAPDGQSAALGGAGSGSNAGRVQVWARGTGRGFL